MRIAAALCVLALVCSGCLRQGEPSAAYAEGTKAFNELYGRYLEEAYAHPDMAAAEEKLASVPKDSSDYRHAQELVKRIQSGRERTQAERDAREEAMANAARPTPNFEFRRDTEPEIAPPAPEAKLVVDAGEAAQPAVGMAIADLQRRWGDCFVAGPSLEVRGQGELSTLELRDLLFCRQRHPGFDQRLVAFEGGTVRMLAEKKDIVQVPVADAGAAPARDGG